MTPIELLTQRWFCVQEARLKEIQAIVEKVDVRQRAAVVEQLNSDPFWENNFDILEKEIRKVDPDNELLTENQVPV